MMLCAVFLRAYLISSSSIDLIESGRGRVDGLGVHYESFGSLCAPIPGLLISLGIDVELGQEGLDAVLILDR